MFRRSVHRISSTTAKCPSPRSHTRLPLRTFNTSPGTMSDFTPITTKDACPPAGPYSQAIKTPHQIYVSGQIPADATGALVGGSITEQTRQCIHNVAAILAAAGSSVGKVVKVNVFLTDMAHFAEMNAEYERHFGHKPARSCVAVRALPKGVPVEIECVALP